MLEAIPTDRLTSAQAGHYNFLKGKLRLLEEKLIDGYHQRTLGLPAYEQREPDIAFSVIGELRDKNREVHSDNENLMCIVTECFYWGVPLLLRRSCCGFRIWLLQSNQCSLYSF